MSDPSIEIDIPVGNRRSSDTPGSKALHVVLPWTAIVALSSLLGWHLVQKDVPVATDPFRTRFEERQTATERRLDAVEARATAQFDEIIRRLDRIEDRLDKK